MLGITIPDEYALLGAFEFNFVLEFLDRLMTNADGSCEACQEDIVVTTTVDKLLYKVITYLKKPIKIFKIYEIPRFSGFSKWFYSIIN